MRTSQHQGLRALSAHLVMKSLHSAEMAGFAGNVTWRAFSMTSSRKISLLAAALAEWPPPKQHLVQHHSHPPKTSTCLGRIGDESLQSYC